MQKIAESRVSAWKRLAPNRSAPGAIDMVCPACRRTASFSTSDWRAMSGDDFHATGRCPADSCRALVRFMIFNMGVGQRSAIEPAGGGQEREALAQGRRQLVMAPRHPRPLTDQARHDGRGLAGSGFVGRASSAAFMRVLAGSVAVP